MFEQAFKNIDDALRKEAGCASELDYAEQTSWLLFLKYLDSLEQDKAMEAELEGKKYSFPLDELYHAAFKYQAASLLDFVLSHYESSGVEELDQTKLSPLLKLKHHDSITDAVADLGRPDEIGRAFAGFQKYLFQGQDGVWQAERTY
jgi:hypothetical protein